MKHKEFVCGIEENFTEVECNGEILDSRNRHLTLVKVRRWFKVEQVQMKNSKGFVCQFVDSIKNCLEQII